MLNKHFALSEPDFFNRYDSVIDNMKEPACFIFHRGLEVGN